MTGIQKYNTTPIINPEADKELRQKKEDLHALQNLMENQWELLGKLGKKIGKIRKETGILTEIQIIITSLSSNPQADDLGKLSERLLAIKKLKEQQREGNN